MENTIILNTISDYLIAFDNETLRLQEIIKDSDVDNLINEDFDTTELHSYLIDRVEENNEYENNLNSDDILYMKSNYSDIYVDDCATAVAYSIASELTMRISFNREFV